MTRDWEVKRRGSIFLLLDTARNKVQDTALLPCTLKWKCLFLSTVALASLWGGWVKPHCTSHEGARRGHKTNEGSIKKDNFLFNCKSCFSYQLETKVAGGNLQPFILFIHIWRRRYIQNSATKRISFWLLQHQHFTLFQGQVHMVDIWHNNGTDVHSVPSASVYQNLLNAVYHQKMSFPVSF